MVGAIAAPYSILSSVISECEFKPKLPTFVEKNPSHLFYKIHSTSLSISSTFPPHVTLIKDFRFRNRFIPKASSVQSAEYIEEPATKVKFQKSLVLPGCSDSLTLLGTGYREKIFAIISVKVYAAGLYANQSIIEKLNSWKGKSSSEILQDSSLFNSIYQDSLEKSLQIVLVRDVDGKTFWNALDEAISPRIKAPAPVDESSLSTFQSVFQARSLKKGTFIFLTWLAPSKMLVSISSDGLPSTVEATIESMNVTTALFNVFFGDTPVSPSLKASIADRLEMVLK